MGLASWTDTVAGVPTGNAVAEHDDKPEDKMKTSEGASRPEGVPEDARSGAKGDDSPKESPQSTATDLDQSERTTMQRRGLPRLDTTVTQRTSGSQPADLLSLSSEVNIKNPAALDVVSKSSNADPVSSPAAQNLANNEMSPMAPDLLNGSVSEVLLKALH